MKNQYPKLDATFLRSAGIFGAPRLNESIQNKLITAFVDECVKRQIDITSEEIVLKCANLIIDYAILYGDEMHVSEEGYY